MNGVHINAGVVEDKVLIAFGGAAVNWLAFTAEQAREFGLRLLDLSADAECYEHHDSHRYLDKRMERELQAHA